MIGFWNRREIYMGNSMQKLTEVRDMLTASDIPYKYRVVNRNGSALLTTQRSRTGTLGQNMDYAYLYYVYVHKNDYEKAAALLR